MFRVMKYKATLSYGPRDKPHIENPTDEVGGKGFVCIKAIKMLNLHIVHGDD